LLVHVVSTPCPYGPEKGEPEFSNLFTYCIESCGDVYRR
jgi:hypothetical protein